MTSRVALRKADSAVEAPEGKPASHPSNHEIPEGVIASICKALSMGKRVRRTLPGNSYLHIDRQLPFLCVYRRPQNRDDPGTEQLVTGQAAFLVASGERRHQKGISRLVEQIAATMREAFGEFLIIELWAASHDQADVLERTQRPSFLITAPRRSPLSTTIAAFEVALQELKVNGLRPTVNVGLGQRLSPPGMATVIPAARARSIDTHGLGLVVGPVYQDPEDQKVFPLVLRSMRRLVTRACQRAAYDFIHNHTQHQPPHFHALGPRALVKLVWQVDSQLAAVSSAFDFLLVATPTNVQAAWSAFKRSGYQKAPVFKYRRLPFDPVELKRQLYRTPVEQIDDPTLEDLFLRQQLALDRKITLMVDRNTRNALYESLQIYGGVSDELLQTAIEILDLLPAHSREPTPAGTVDAATFAALANEELAYLRRTHPSMTSKVEVREDIIGLLVSRGNLLVGAESRVPQSRVRALLAHELGTHVVTYHNGRAQPFKQLYVGLPNYDELQEGLAVLAEYLVGGLSRPRMRLLAARVVAVRRMVDGASFVDVFHELHTTHEMPKRSAFNVTARIFRSGGLTKDAVYLRGLVDLLAYIGSGGRIEPLYVGKFAFEHLPIIEELQFRHVLGPAPLRPPYLDDREALERLDRLRQGMTLLELIGSTERKK